MYNFLIIIFIIFFIYKLLNLYIYCRKIQKIKVNMKINLFLDEYNKFFKATIIRINKNYLIPFRTFDLKIENYKKLNIIKIHENINLENIYYE